jgi:CRP/FNR family transcriptional regulator
MLLARSYGLCLYYIAGHHSAEIVGYYDCVRAKELDPKRLAARISRAPQLVVLDERTRISIVESAEVRELKAGDTLWLANDQPRRLGFVLLGELTVQRLTSDGQRHVFRRYRQDQLIGLSTVAGAPHSADVVASEDTRVLLLHGDALLKQSAFVEAAFGYLARLIGILSDDYQALLYSGIEGRLERYLRQAALDGLREIKKSHQELADEIGATRSNVARAIRRLAKRGAIDQARGRILLNDVEALGGAEAETSR